MQQCIVDLAIFVRGYFGTQAVVMVMRGVGVDEIVRSLQSFVSYVFCITILMSIVLNFRATAVCQDCPVARTSFLIWVPSRRFGGSTVIQSFVFFAAKIY